MKDDAQFNHAIQLLTTAGTIRHYEHELMRASGETFNIFDVLRVGHYEVKTHSPFLAELLNPEGSHGQGSTFLRLFMEVSGLTELDVNSASVRTEVGIDSLGRIDIFIIDSNGHRILIENKIYAQLGDRQLERYNEFDPKAKLLFLTLDDAKPEEVPKEVLPISYKVHILEWLDLCRKESANVPVVRETITSYIHLIQRLTNQNISSRMNQKLLDTILKDKDTYNAYASLKNADREIRKFLIGKVNGMVETIAKELECEVVEIFSCKFEKYEGCFLTFPQLRKYRLQFGISCEKGDYGDIEYGFAWEDHKHPDNLFKVELQEKFKSMFNALDSTDAWPAGLYWNERRHWGDETMADIVSGEFEPELKAVLSRLKEVATSSITAFESQST